MPTKKTFSWLVPFKVAYLVLCWIPLAMYHLVYMQTRQTEGWGQWSMAGAYLIPLTASLTMILAGLCLIFSLHRAGKRIRPAVMATILAASPLLYFVVLWIIASASR